MAEIDARMQDFQYTFECGSRLEKLSFRTFKSESSNEELSEICSVYGDPEVTTTMRGFKEGTVACSQDAENTKRFFREKTSLAQGNKDGSHSIRWKLYYSSDTSRTKLVEQFIGFCGVCLTESKMLQPHLALKSKYHNQRLGTKAILSIIAKLLSHTAWLLANVTGVFTIIQPKNAQCLSLKDRLGSSEIAEQPNPERKDGIWLENIECFSDKVIRSFRMRHFVCKNVKFLVLLFETFTRPAMYKRYHLHLDKAVNEGVLLNNVETSLQQFCFMFESGAKKEKVYFRTMKCPGSRIELREILSVFGGAKMMKKYGLESERDLMEHARIMREIMREEISLEGIHNTIRWRVSYSNESSDGNESEVFIGYTTLCNNGRTLEPNLCLHSNYRRKGLGKKIFMCLMMKLWKHKSWLKEYFDDILITMNSENLGSLALKKVVLEGLDMEELNHERDDGLWVYKGTTYPFDNVSDITKRRFRSPCFSVIQRALMLKQSGTFKRNGFPYYDKHEEKNYVLSRVEPCSSVGVKPVSLYAEDVKSIIQQLLSREATPFAKEVQVVNSFQVEMPTLVSRQPWHSGSFFLFFFAEGCQVQSFEVPEYPSERRRIEQTYLAFEKICKRTPRLTARLPKEFNGTLKAYLAELDMDVFEKQRHFLSGLRSLWTSTEFQYRRNKRRRWPGEFAHLLHLKEVKVT